MDSEPGPSVAELVAQFDAGCVSLGSTAPTAVADSLRSIPERLVWTEAKNQRGSPPHGR